MSDHDDAPTLPDGVVVLSRVQPLRAKGSADGEDELPGRVKILDWGENRGRTTGANIRVGEKTLECLETNQESFAHERVPMDYEHQSVPGHPNYKSDPRHSPGNGRVTVIEGEGVFLDEIEYTPNGRDHALSYQDVSAVAHIDSEGNLVMVGSVALTQNGDVDGMTFAEALATLSARKVSGEKQSQSKSKSKMDDNTETDYRALLVGLLGLSPEDGQEEVTDEAIAAAAENFSKPSDKKEEKPSESEVALNARMDSLERNAIVAKATADGKVIPLSAEDLEKTTPKALSAMVEKIEPTVPLKGGKTDEQPLEDDGKVALSADQKAVAKKLGLSEEQYRAGLSG